MLVVKETKHHHVFQWRHCTRYETPKDISYFYILSYLLSIENHLMYVKVQ